MGRNTHPAAETLPGPQPQTSTDLIGTIAAVADTLIPHPVYEADFRWNEGVRAFIQQLVDEATEGGAR